MKNTTTTESDTLTCPGCGHEHVLSDLYQDLHGMITGWGDDDNLTEIECSGCEKIIVAEEHVSRWWECSMKEPS